MDVLKFIGALLLLVVGGILLYVRAKKKRDIGRDPRHSVYHPTRSRHTKKHHAGDNLVHSHSSHRIQAAEKLWSASRVKANEEHWESGVITANKILSDSELALEDGEDSHGFSMPSIDYEPVETKRSSSGAAGMKGSKR